MIQLNLKHYDELLTVGWIGVVYIFARTVGTYCGAGIAAWFSGAEAILQRWIGLSLLPQAGVALGMALLASQRFPELKNTILPIVIGSTVFFEFVGPVITRRVLKHVKSVEPTFIKIGRE